MYIYIYKCTCLYIYFARTKVQDPNGVAPYIHRYTYICINIHVYIYLAQTHVPYTDAAVPNRLTKKKAILYLFAKLMIVKVWGQ